MKQILSKKMPQKKFGALDKDKKGYISITDIVSIREIDNNTPRYHIAQDMSNNDEKEAISFEAFIKVDILKIIKMKNNINLCMICLILIKIEKYQVKIC
jgi:Ca2+-binding EF-hand superfamily protein